MQTSVLEALAENQSAFSQVINNMGSYPQTDGHFNFVPQEYLLDKNVPPLQPSANSTLMADSQLSQLVKTLTQEVSNMKATMLQSHAPFQLTFPQN